MVGSAPVAVNKPPGKSASRKIFLDVPRMEQPKDAETDSAWVAQLVERVLGKDEVTGSIPVPGSRSSAVLEVSRGLSGGNSTVESHSSKVMVAGSNPVPRSKGLKCSAAAAEWQAQKAKEHGEGEIRAQQAAREHWDDRAHRSWQNDVDRRDHQGAQ